MICVYKAGEFGVSLFHLKVTTISVLAIYAGFTDDCADINTLNY